MIARPSNDSPIEQAVHDFLAARLQAGDRVAVGFSGGLDSVVLLHLLNKLAPQLKIELSAIHVHHGLSKNADKWLIFCENTCKNLDVSLQAVRVQVATNNDGIEAAARTARYQAFGQAFQHLAEEHAVSADKRNWLALAHHRGDQAETLLFNLLRGSGVSGMAGMPQQRCLSNETSTGNETSTQLLRPLLHQPRAELEAYARQHRLRWIEDESNDDQRYTRNFLRHEILPRLKTVFPAAEKTLTRASEHFAQANQLLHELALIDRKAVCNAQQRIEIAAFSRLSDARACNLLRYEIYAHGQRQPGTRQLQETVHQLRSTHQVDAHIQLALDDLILQCWRGALYFVPAFYMSEEFSVQRHCVHQPENNETREIPWAQGIVQISLCVGEGIRADAWLGKAWLSTRNAEPAARLRLSPKRPSRSLKQLMQEAEIPPWERPLMPMLWINGKLAWIAGIGVDTALACPADEAGIRLDFQSSY